MPHRALITRPWRLVALLSAVLCWVLMALVGAYFAGDRTPGKVDSAVIQTGRALFGNRRSAASKLLLLPSEVAFGVLIIAVIVTVALIKRRFDVVALVLAAPVVTLLLTDVVLKPLVGRRFTGYLSYPSGHTTLAVDTFTVVLLAAFTVPRFRVRLPAVLGWLGATAMVMLGLVQGNYHYFTDTVGGVLLAVGTVLSLAVVLGVLGDRARPSAPRPGTAPPAGTPHAGISSDTHPAASPR